MEDTLIYVKTFSFMTHISSYSMKLDYVKYWITQVFPLEILMSTHHGTLILGYPKLIVKHIFPKDN